MKIDQSINRKTCRRHLKGVSDEIWTFSKHYRWKIGDRSTRCYLLGVGMLVLGELAPGRGMPVRPGVGMPLPRVGGDTARCTDADGCRNELLGDVIRRWLLGDGWRNELLGDERDWGE